VVGTGAGVTADGSATTTDGTAAIAAAGASGGVAATGVVGASGDGISSGGAGKTEVVENWGDAGATGTAGVVAGGATASPSPLLPGLAVAFSSALSLFLSSAEVFATLPVCA
jgi:hypothetical protein